MSEKGDFVEVTVKIPKRLWEFLKSREEALEETVEEYLAGSVVDRVRADLDTEEVFVPSSKRLIERYSLAEILNDP